MKMRLSLCLFGLALSLVSMASVKVTSVDFAASGATGQVKVKLEGRTNSLPDMRVYGNVLEVTLSQSDAFPAISKTVRGTLLTANALNGKAVIKAILPYSVPENAVNLSWSNNSIAVSFPRKNAAVTTAATTPVSMKEPVSVAKEAIVKPVIEEKVQALPESKISKDILNEDYLNKLMKEQPTISDNAKSESAMPPAQDVVNVKQASNQKQNDLKAEKPLAQSNAFSFSGYALKFGVFLLAVLGLFYGIVQLLKKGIFSKGKLSFLNNTQMIQVLSTTYIAPKRSLMIVKAHKQIFLVANSESGLTFLSEMTDTSGLIKEGEKLLTGTNFDDKLDLAEAQKGYDAFIKVKENIMESTPVQDEAKGLAKLAATKDDVVRFSDELKKKAKKLKPIEFN